jgi:DNA polymerase III psi subunit
MTGILAGLHSTRTSHVPLHHGGLREVQLLRWKLSIPKALETSILGNKAEAIRLVTVAPKNPECNSHRLLLKQT